VDKHNALLSIFFQKICPYLLDVPAACTEWFFQHFMGEVGRSRALCPRLADPSRKVSKKLGKTFRRDSFALTYLRSMTLHSEPPGPPKVQPEGVYANRYSTYACSPSLDA
jgi:hypothetical protein